VVEGFGLLPVCVKNIEYHRLGFFWSSRVWKIQANAMQKISTTKDKPSAGDPIPPKGHGHRSRPWIPWLCIHGLEIFENYKT